METLTCNFEFALSFNPYVPSPCCLTHIRQVQIKDKTVLYHAWKDHLLLVRGYKWLLLNIQNELKKTNFLSTAKRVGLNELKIKHNHLHISQATHWVLNAKLPIKNWVNSSYSHAAIPDICLPIFIGQYVRTGTSLGFRIIRQKVIGKENKYIPLYSRTFFLWFSIHLVFALNLFCISKKTVEILARTFPNPGTQTKIRSSEA